MLYKEASYILKSQLETETLNKEAGLFGLVTKGFSALKSGFGKVVNTAPKDQNKQTATKIKDINKNITNKTIGENINNVKTKTTNFFKNTANNINSKTIGEHWQSTKNGFSNLTNNIKETYNGMSTLQKGIAGGVAATTGIVGGAKMLSNNNPQQQG